MNQSESIKEIATALSKVQGQLTHAVKDSANPFFKSKYADLGSVWDSCRKLLADNGLSVMQFPGDYVEGSISLTTMLTHSSGEWINHNMSLPVSKPDAQGVGSAITYMRRYALAAVIGIYQADDDGNEAVKPVAKVEVKKEVKTEDVIDTSHKALAKALIDFGALCESFTELASLWKKNEKQIDLMKAEDKVSFNELQKKFAEYKSNFKE